MRQTLPFVCEVACFCFSEKFCRSYVHKKILFNRSHIFLGSERITSISELSIAAQSVM